MVHTACATHLCSVQPKTLTKGRLYNITIRSFDSHLSDLLTQKSFHTLLQTDHMTLSAMCIAEDSLCGSLSSVTPIKTFLVQFEDINENIQGIFDNIDTDYTNIIMLIFHVSGMCHLFES